MEEISKGQVTKWLICFAQELAIFPEGTLCVCVCVCVCTRMHVHVLSDLRFFRIALTAAQELNGGWESWELKQGDQSFTFSNFIFHDITTILLQPFLLHILSKQSIDKLRIGSLLTCKAFNTYESQLILQGQTSKIILSCAFCQDL